jgi:hypothetical protein
LGESGADYIVDVTDEAGVLTGYWHSLGDQDPYGNGGDDPADNSKVDPFAVSIGGDNPVDNLNVDFGYYLAAAALGNYVWDDTNGNGIQDPASRASTASKSGSRPPTPTAPATASRPSPATTRAPSASSSRAGTASPTCCSTRTTRAAPRARRASPSPSTPSLAQSGEVEDYLVGIVPAGGTLDFGDLPDPSYPTLLASNGARHLVVDGTILGSLIDVEADGQPNAAATGDNLANLDDEDGVSFTGTPIPGASATVAVSAPNGGVLNAWIDFNGDGDFNDAGEQIASDLLLGTGTSTLIYSVPANAVPGATGARFRITTASGEGGENPTGLATSGEVEDYLVTVGGTPPNGLDFGDLPDTGAGTGAGNYQTLASDNGAQHIIDGVTFLGLLIDAEANGQPNATATGDNITASDDEDGVSFSALTAGSPASVDVVSSAVGNVLNAWIDFNGDGDFSDAGEQIINNLTLAAGSNPIGYNVPLGAVPGQTGARFRVTAASGQGGDSPTGLASTGEVEDYLVSIATSSAPLGAIGNRVWLDENGDGIQDAGEPGIGGVTVELLDNSGTVIAVTLTDTDGGYLFPNLPAGDYQIRVDTQTLPLDNNGNPVVQSQLARPNEDFGNQTQLGGTGGDAYPVTLVAGEENLTADFGYNWQPSGNVEGNTGPAALGDRIWIDANGDGVQDPGEPGVAGVSVTLTGAGADGIFGTGDDTTASTTTGPAGDYIFNDLPTGAYTVTVDAANFDSGQPLENYVQTGDPDEFGQPATAPDNTTTTPVVLAPGDVFLNADFGYKPPAAQDNAIGDTIWFDANGDGVYQPDGGDGVPGTADDEYGIAGVTVTLLNDNDEPIATTVTDENGEYLFPGLPDGTYTVVVDDTDNVLGELAPTYDADGGDDNQSTTSGQRRCGRPVAGLRLRPARAHGRRRSDRRHHLPRPQRQQHAGRR